MIIPAELWEALEDAIGQIEARFDDLVAEIMKMLPEDMPEYDRTQPVKSQRPGEAANKTCVPSHERWYTAATGG